MRKLIIFTLPIAILFLFNTASAQENSQTTERSQRLEEEIYTEETIQRLKEEYTQMLRDCEAGENNELCAKATEVTLQGLKALAVERLEGSFTRTQNMAERMRSTNNLSSEEEAILTETLNSHKNLVDAHTQRVKDAQSLQELQAFARERFNNDDLKIQLRQLSVRRMKLGFLNIQHFINKMNNVVQRIDLHIVAAQNAGQDTSEVEKHLTFAKEKIRLAQNIYDQNSDLLDKELNGTGIYDIEDIKVQLLKSKDLLMEAKGDLRNAVTELKKLYNRQPWELE